MKGASGDSASHRQTEGRRIVLTISNLHVSVAGADILRGLSLAVPAGEVHAIMGPNGSGKSTLSYAVAGREGYDVTQGDVALDGASILGLDPSARAAKGVFLSFQHPMEIPG
ncbi:MAG: ATP-binding cassette domain-containing protein, partial [Parvularculaceae bacterium]|nr:ATP-binding cassette domain-containing protein [Parvularculaceae bacterium]